MAAALARRTPNNSAICVLGNTLALYQPATPRGRGVRHARLHDRRAADRRLPGRHVDGRQLSATASRPPRPGPASTRPHDLIMKAWTQPGPVHLQRPLQPAALREPVAEAAAEAAPAGVAGRRRLGGDVGAGRQQRLHLQLPQLLRLPVRQEVDGRLLGHHATAWGPIGTPIGPVSPSRSACRRPTRRPRRSTSSTSRTSSTSACTSRRTSSRRPAIAPGAAPSSPSRPTSRARSPRWRSWRRTGRRWSTRASSSPAARRPWPTASSRRPRTCGSATCIALLQIGSMGHELTEEEHHPVRRGGAPQDPPPVGRRGLGAQVVAAGPRTAPPPAS